MDQLIVTAQPSLSLPMQHHASPATVLAVAALTLDVLGRLAARPTESLSASELALQALFDGGGVEDLQSITERARLEMGDMAVNILRMGEM